MGDVTDGLAEWDDVDYAISQCETIGRSVPGELRRGFDYSHSVVYFMAAMSPGAAVAGRAGVFFVDLIWLPER